MSQMGEKGVKFLEKYVFGNLSQPLQRCGTLSACYQYFRKKTTK